MLRNLSSKIVSIIEKNIGHKVNKIVPFLSSSSSSTASTAAPSTKPGAASSSSSTKTTQSTSSSKKKTTQKHDTEKITGLTISRWKSKNKTFLVTQLRHRGVTITTEQLKGGIDENGEKIEKIKNLEMADMIIKIDGLTE